MRLFLRTSAPLLAVTFFFTFSGACKAEQCDDPCQLGLVIDRLVRGDSLGAEHDLKLIADRGYVPAKLALADYYMVNEHAVATGRAILLPLAESGDPKAQLRLAQSYLGLGSPSSDAIGVSWLVRAADGKEPSAIKLMSHALRAGWWGIARNPTEADRYDAMLTTHAS